MSTSSNEDTTTTTNTNKPKEEKITFEDRVSRNVMYVLIFTIVAACALMIAAMYAPHPDAVEKVLPFATGIVGFLGGLITAIFGK